MIMKSSTAVQRSWLFGAIVSILLIFFYIHNIDPDPVKLSSSSFPETSTIPSEYHPLDIAQLHALLYKPFIHHLDARTFTGDDQRTYALSQPPRFTRPLGKKVLLLDVDTRPMNEPGGMLNIPMNYDELTLHAAGILNHYLYCRCYLFWERKVS